MPLRGMAVLRMTRGSPATDRDEPRAVRDIHRRAGPQKHGLRGAAGRLAAPSGLLPEGVAMHVHLCRCHWLHTHRFPNCPAEMGAQLDIRAHLVRIEDRPDVADVEGEIVR
jgi:hypothetical protein